MNTSYALIALLFFCCGRTDGMITLSYHPSRSLCTQELARVQKLMNAEKLRKLWLEEMRMRCVLRGVK